MGSADTLSAQFHDLDLPADSPAWWTLTDEISSKELRAAHRDPAGNLKRFLRDVESGEIPYSISPQKAERVTFHVSGFSDPELVPLWVAFNQVATIRTVPGFAMPDARLLAEFGVSPSGVETILDLATRQRDLIFEGYERLKPLHQECVQLRQRAENALGGDKEASWRVHQAMVTSDAPLLARLGEITLPRSKLLLDAFNTKPHFLAAMRTVPELRERLDEADWNAMRRYFLAYVTLPMSIVQKFD